MAATTGTGMANKDHHARFHVHRPGITASQTDRALSHVLRCKECATAGKLVQLSRKALLALPVGSVVAEPRNHRTAEPTAAAQTLYGLS